MCKYTNKNKLPHTICTIYILNKSFQTTSVLPAGASVYYKCINVFREQLLLTITREETIMNNEIISMAFEFAVKNHDARQRLKANISMLSSKMVENLLTNEVVAIRMSKRQCFDIIRRNCKDDNRAYYFIDNINRIDVDGMTGNDVILKCHIDSCGDITASLRFKRETIVFVSPGDFEQIVSKGSRSLPSYLTSRNPERGRDIPIRYDIADSIEIGTGGDRRTSGADYEPVRFNQI